MKCPTRFLLTLGFLLLVRINPALAFQLRPMSQVLAPLGAEATQTYEVFNDQDQRIAIEISVLERQMNLNGDETYTSAEDDFLIYPAQIIVEPGATQVVQVRWLGDPEPEQELAFRLSAEQLPINLLDPNQPAVEQPTGDVQILLRYLGSLYVRPAGVHAAVHVESVMPHVDEQGNDGVMLVFTNTGTASAKLRDLRLTLTSQGQSVTLSQEQLAGMTDSTILPGHDRRYLLPWPAELPQGSLTATFNYRQD